MSALKAKPTLAAKAVQMVYEFPGNLKKGWEAERTGDSTYLLHRKNGSTRVLNLYEPIRTANGDQLPMRNNHGLLTIGEWSVLVGRNINHSLHARKVTAANTYLLFDESMKNLGKFKIGDQHNGKPVALVDGHLLQVGDDIVAVKPKKHDITLLVMTTEAEGGNISYINFIELGNGMNRKDGARGIFIRPKKTGEPAQFVENYNGQKVVTAHFWIEKNDKKVSYQYRDAKTALMSSELSKKLEEARDVAINVGIEPEDYDEYVEINKKLMELGNCWKKDAMVVMVGHDLFRPKERGQSNVPPIPS